MTKREHVVQVHVDSLADRNSRTRLFLALVTVALVAIAAVGAEKVNRRDASRIALARQLALQGAELRDINAEKAARLGAAAVRIHSDDQTRSALADTLIAPYRTDLPGTGIVRAVALSGDGRLAMTGATGEKVTLWDLGARSALYLGGGPFDPQRLAVLDGTRDVEALALTSNGRTALTGGRDGSAILWDLTDPSHPVKLATSARDSFDRVDDVALAQDGKTALVGYTHVYSSVGAAAVWDLTRKSRPAGYSSLTGHRSWLQGLALSADGQTAVTVSDGAAFVWDLTGRPSIVRSAALEYSDHYQESVALSSDGRIALIGSSASVADVWDLSDRSHPVHRASVEDDFHDVFAVALSRDGRTALTGGTHGLVILWDLSDPSHPVRLAALRGHTNGVEAVALSEDGRIALTGSINGGAQVWDLSAVDKDPLRSACMHTSALQGVTIDALKFDQVATGPVNGREEWSAYFDNGRYFRPCSE
ncbi:WD40 repeat domain-containing protein [Microtetraspora malaysiensis]|uniref:WD40 repeat domain-containing protein n=1 Tax=Microtetraspora malaysiensis TaxID=161358 RepID=UPI003D8EE16B